VGFLLHVQWLAWDLKVVPSNHINASTDGVGRLWITTGGWLQTSLCCLWVLDNKSLLCIHAGLLQHLGQDLSAACGCWTTKACCVPMQGCCSTWGRTAMDKASWRLCWHMRLHTT
jgi:hypothetical protein